MQSILEEEGLVLNRNDLFQENLSIPYKIMDYDLTQYNKPKSYKTKSKARPEILSFYTTRGHWSIIQNERYHVFLEFHHTYFIQSQLRRINKIFKLMAQFIGTRAADQCRSHHQKMEKKYGRFFNILLNLRKMLYPQQSGQQILNKLSKQNITFPYQILPQSRLVKK